VLSLALAAATAKTLVKAIYPTTSIGNLLLAGKEWMALRTHVNVKVFTGRGTSFDLVTTATSRCDILIFGVYFCLHGIAPLWHRHPISVEYRT
jgi:hypothetical protein